MNIVYNFIIIIINIFLCISLLMGCVHVHQVNFINEVCIKPYKRYNYHTCDDMNVTIDGDSYVIPKNFETDLASIPRILWPFLAPQYSGFVAPAILHDYLYSSNMGVSRKFADEVLYSALIMEGVSPFTATKFYLAVRLFGSSHFNRGR